MNVIQIKLVIIGRSTSRQKYASRVCEIKSREVSSDWASLPFVRILLRREPPPFSSHSPLYEHNVHRTSRASWSEENRGGPTSSLCTVRMKRRDARILSDHMLPKRGQLFVTVVERRGQQGPRAHADWPFINRSVSAPSSASIVDG